MSHSQPFIDYDGSLSWLDGDRRLHREDGPALILNDGTKYWYRHGRIHRDGEPAVIHADGTLQYYNSDYLHRDGGPAVIEINGKEEWYLYGWRHRIDGPAVIEGKKCKWFLRGKLMSNYQEFKRYSGLPDEEILLLILRYGEIK